MQNIIHYTKITCVQSLPFTHVILMTHPPQGGTIFEGDAGYSGNLYQALVTLNVGQNDDIDCWHTLRWRPCQNQTQLNEIAATES